MNAQRYWVDCKTLSQYINKGYGFPIFQYRGNKTLVFFTDNNDEPAKEQARKICAAPEVFRQQIIDQQKIGN